MDPFFLLLIVITLSAAVAFSLATRDIQFFSTETDNALQVYAASQAHRWRLPSDVHKYGKGKTAMKDVTIMLIAVFQRIMRDKTTEHPLITMCGFANGFSAIFIYLIARAYWDAPTALFLALFFFLSAWIWQVALFGGHIIDATTIFLASVFLVQYAPLRPDNQFWLLMTAGAVFCLTMFASASARKYIVLFLAALFYAKYASLINAGAWDTLLQTMSKNYTQLFTVFLPLFVMASFVVLFSIYRNIVMLMYQGKAPQFLTRVMKGRETVTLQKYIVHARTLVMTAFKKTVSVTVFLALVTNLIGLDVLIPAFIGFFAIVILFTVPNVAENIKNYFHYYYLAQTKGHFRIYINYFKKIGKPIPHGMRGQGWLWVIKFFWRVMPYHVTLGATATAYLIALSSLSPQPLATLMPTALLFLLFLSPTAWGEFTKGPQLGRSYLPALVSILPLLGFSMLRLPPDFAWIPFTWLLPLTLWNGGQLLRDIYPARMASTTLMRVLTRSTIKRIYTYRTPYNDAFLNNIDPAFLAGYDLHYISRLDEVPDDPLGMVVIPGTSSKALNMESVPETIEAGDFRDDPCLNELIDTAHIASLAHTRIATFGTSRFWGHESEVTSFRDLILGEIRAADHWRGYGWCIPAQTINRVLPQLASAQRMASV